MIRGASRGRQRRAPPSHWPVARRQLVAAASRMRESPAPQIRAASPWNRHR
jgi:hypothetical protein